MRARAKVFVKDGNRFIVPGLWYDEDDPEARPASLIIEAMMWSVTMNLDTEKEWLEFDPANLPHFRVTMTSRALEHGGADVLLISGPMFDEAMARG